MKNDLKIWVKSACLAWVFLSYIMLIFGIMDMSSTVIMTSQRCKEDMRRIDYIAPGYIIGCWLGDYVEKDVK